MVAHTHTLHLQQGRRVGLPAVRHEEGKRPCASHDLRNQPGSLLLGTRST